jgi:hypothetical protein
MDTRTLVLFIVQAVLAVIALRLLNWRVFPQLRFARHPELVVDVWIPLAMVLPMVFLAGHVDSTVRGIGWVPIGGPICAGILVMGAAMVASRGRGQIASPGWATLICWAAAGLVLLMLGAAHDLTIWTGQCAFALAAVLLWMNTPVVGHAPGGAATEHSTSAGGWWLALVLLCAIGQGVAGLLITGRGSAASAAMMVIYAGAAGAGTAVLAGPGWAMRIGGWAAAVGMLLGIGLISLLELMPQALAVALVPQAGVRAQVAHGFGAYALEAALLLMAPVAVVAAIRLPRRPAALIGVGILVIGAAIATWRVSGL